MGAAFGRLTRRKLGFVLLPVDIARSTLKTRQHEDAQMLRHGIGEADELRPTGQKQLTGKSRTRIEGQAACLQALEPAINLRQRDSLIDQRIDVRRPAARVKAGARRGPDDQLATTESARQDLVSRLLSEGAQVLALARRAAFRYRRLIDVEGDVKAINIEERA